MALSESEEEEDEEEGTDMESDLEGKKEEGKRKIISSVYVQELVYCHTSTFNFKFAVFLRPSQ